VEQLQIIKSLKYLRIKIITALQAIAHRALEFKSLVIAARTHNVVAQPTTLGKRFAMFGQELLIALERLDQLIERYPLRGLKGAVGTLLDQKTLFANDSVKVERLQKLLLKHLKFKNLLNAVGQVYPRSLDFDVVSALQQLGAGPSSFCKTLRLMAGQALISEGFQKDQIGSSAMPHKMNSRNCERVNGLQVILSGHVAMTSFLSGDQWNEGDVSCSVVRRVVLPDSFFAIDGLLETFLTILQEMKVFPERIRLEVEQVTPFLASTTLLMKAVQKGIGREKAHHLLKKHSTDVIEDLLKGRIEKNDLVSRLGQDKDFPLSEKEIVAIFSDPTNFIGEATVQVQKFAKHVDAWVKKFPDSKTLKPEPLL
jgi:adenylosuccinate lyase